MRSSRFRLLSLATLSSFSLALVSCGDNSSQQSQAENAPPVYADRAACEIDYSAEDCAKYGMFAEEEYAKTAPRYSSLSECEEKYGPSGCRPRTESGSSVFMPLFLGFAMGHMLSRPQAVYPQPIVNGVPGGYVYAGGGTQTVRPTMPAPAPRSAFSSTSTNTPVVRSTAPNTFAAPRSAPSAPSVSAPSVSRGISGSSARGGGGGGGGS